ncbi:MAG TPA: prepilin-type cleavage/methylation domain-containing protein, partial [Acinetobacter sp.]|nr:prepilin-type cleavage/methylation domain-containing protein [Acinetobacter sp.]
MKHESGFTLIELMISMILGLLITAAAIQLYITAQKNMAIQQGAANLQNSASFGLEYMLRNIRLANLNSGKPIMDPSILHGGIVLNKANLSTNPTFQITGASTSNNLMTAGSIGPSNLQGEKSDQLVIQYRNTINNKYNCEGVEIASNVYVVERYFLRT